MRVLHIIVGLKTGGAEIMLEKLTIASAGRGAFRHAVVSLTTPGRIGPRLEAQGIPVQALGMTGVRDIPRVLMDLRRRIRADRPVIVQTWMYHADLLGGVAARLAGCSSVLWSVHSSNVLLPGTRSARWIFPLCALLSHVIPEHIVGVSEAVVRTHAGRGYDARKMVVIPNGIDRAALQVAPGAGERFRQAESLPRDAVMIGCVARFNATKDIETLVRAATLLMKRHDDARFLLVGAGMEEGNAELQGWIQATRRPERFHLLGERTDVPDCLAAMDIFCLPSRTEAFGLAVGEAMAMGKPCIVTNVDGLPGLVGDTGLVVPPQDPDALARAMDTLVAAGPEARAAQGERGRARIAAHFSLDSMVGQYEALYARMAGKTASFASS